MSNKLNVLNIENFLENKYKVVLILSFVCYWKTIFGEFVFDDTEAILNNKDVVTDTNLSQIFGNDFWGTDIGHNSSHKSYRPLSVITFRLIRHLDQLIESNENSLNPYLYHLFNVLVYAVFNIFVLKLFNELLNTFCPNDKSFIQTNCSDNRRNAFLATLLFICHPIHSESVSASVGLADLLSSLIALLTLLVYIKFTTNSKRFTFVSFTYSSLLIVVLSSVAMLFKEQGITFIGLCIVFDVILIFERPKYNSYPIERKLLIYRIICLLSGTFLLLLIRLKIMNFKGPQFQRGDNPSSFESSFLIRILNYNYIYAINAWIMVLPDWLCFDWSMGCIPLIKNILDYRIIFVMIFWIILLFLIKSSIFHFNSNIKRQIQISLAFGIIPFIPSANIFFRVGFVVAERALFLPTIGYSLLIITGFNSLQKRFVNHFKILHILFLILLFVMTIRTFRRSLDWNNERQLFESGLRVCPLNAKIHYNIAKNAADNGFKQKAINEYREAIRLNPEYDHAFNNLANIIKESGSLEESKELLLKAVRIRPSFAAAWMNLAIVQTALKQFSEAEASYLNALKHRRSYADCLYNLGNLYVQQHRFEEAYKVWRNATIIKVNLLSAWNNLILMLDNIGSYERAHDIALEALKYHTNQSSLHFNYANVLGKMGNFVESETHFMRAIALDPQKANYYSNLGVLYHRFKHYSKAMANYKIALNLDPNLESAQKNLELLKKISHK